MKKLYSILFAVALLCGASSAYAIVSPPLTIANVRAHVAGDVFITFTSTVLNCTSTFKVSVSTVGGQAIHKQALAAHLAQKEVKIEIGACNGYGTSIGSLYIL